MMNRINRWQRLWVLVVLVWGVFIYAQTEFPQRPLVNIPHDSLPAVMAAEAAQEWRILINRFGYWLLTSAGLYVVGHGIAWSRRGLSSDINHLR